jgi:hypothetical protein
MFCASLEVNFGQTTAGQASISIRCGSITRPATQILVFMQISCPEQPFPANQVLQQE